MWQGELIPCQHHWAAIIWLCSPFRFVQAQAKLQGQAVMPVWVFDEAHAFQQRARKAGEATWIAALLCGFA